MEEEMVQWYYCTSSCPIKHNNLPPFLHGKECPSGCTFASPFFLRLRQDVHLLKDTTLLQPSSEKPTPTFIVSQTALGFSRFDWADPSELIAEGDNCGIQSGWRRGE